jgi:hypothetical protein
MLSSTHYSALEAERMILGEKVLTKNYAPIAQEFLKKGCPQCLRAKIWTLILGAEVKPYVSASQKALPTYEKSFLQHYSYFESLKESVLQYDLMIDKLIIKDINLTASNDDQYFVFEDVLYQVLLCFSRDGDVLKDLSTQPGFMQVVIKGKQSNTENTIIFPPSGVIPFHGFTMYGTLSHFHHF